MSLQDTPLGTPPVDLDLPVIIKAAQALSSEMDLFKLLRQTMKLCLENAGAQKGVLILEKEEKTLYIEAIGTVTVTDEEKKIEIFQSLPVTGRSDLSVAIVNYVHQTGEDIVLNDAVHSEEFENDPYIMETKPKSILCAPIRYKGKTAGIIYLENNLMAHAFTPERIEILQILSAQAAISIENSLLAVAREQAVKTETEMKIAEEIQTAILPRAPLVDGYDVTAYMRPADDVGGDYYDIINTDAADWVLIGDVCGHGVAAGLIMMMVQTAFQSIVNHVPHASPASVVAEVNKVIMNNIQRMDDQKYMTVTALTVQPTGQIIHAGMHQDIMIYRSKTKDVEVVKTSGMWIGLIDDISEMLDDRTLVLEKEDVMLLYTDGIVEAWKGDSMFEDEQLMTILQKTGDQPSHSIKDAILSALADYHTPDDLTLVILKRL